MKHSYSLQNNELTKIKEEINYDKFHDFIGISLERMYLLDFDAPLINIEKVSWLLLDQNSDKGGLEKEKTLGQLEIIMQAKMIRELFYYDGYLLYLRNSAYP